MKRSLALVLVLAVAMPAAATSYMPLSVHRISKKDLREAAKRKWLEERFCRKAQRAKGQIAKLGSLTKISFDRRNHYSYLLERGEEGCPKDLNLAIALAETLIEGQPLLIATDTYMVRLVELLRLRGRPGDLARADELYRYLWLRGSYQASTAPTWTLEERRAFTARDDVWGHVSKTVDGGSAAYRLHRDAVLDPLSLHYSPTKAVVLLERSYSAEDRLKAAQMLLEGRLIQADQPRAEAILWGIAKDSDDAVLLLINLHQSELASNDPWVRQLFLVKLLPFVDRTPPRSAAVRERIAPYYLPGLTNPDPQVQIASARLLAKWAGPGTQSVLPPLLAWIEPRLVSADTAIANEARSLLRMLVESGVTAAHPVMNREYARNGGLVQGGDWTPDPLKPAKFQNFITPNDYPTRAMREERSGVVRATAVFGPDGRIFLIEITESSGHLDLDQTVRATLTRRMRRSWAEHPGRFVRVKLPPIQFRIRDSDGTVDTPPLEGAVQVDAVRLVRPVYETPVVVHSMHGT